MAVAESRKVAGVGKPWGRGRLDLDGYEPAPGQLGKEVDLEASLLLADVVEARPRGRDRELGSQLGGDERVEQPAQQVAVPQHVVGVEPQDGAGQRGVDQVPLRRQDEALEPVGRPRRERLDDARTPGRFGG
jgi:hypothetical protein